MSEMLFAAIVFTLGCYVLSMALCLLRLVRGPSAQDRVLAMDLICTVAMLVLMVLAIRYRSVMYFEAALLIVAVRLHQFGGHGQVPAAWRGDRMNAARVAVDRSAGGAAARDQRPVHAGGRLRRAALRQLLPAHAPARAGLQPVAAWCVTLATILYFSAQQEQLSLHAWLIIIFLSLTVPVTTILLARTELFRRRPSVADSGDMPAALSQPDSPTRDAVPGRGNNGHAP